MAPAVVSIAVVRPLKVVALICCCAVLVLFTLALASSDWLLADGWRRGLFTLCAARGESSSHGCRRVEAAPLLQATRALCGVCVVGALLAAVLTGAGLHTACSSTKRRMYYTAAAAAALTLALWLLALLLYPVGFVLRWTALEGPAGTTHLWQFGWAYGVAWGAAVFLCAAAVLLICDRESEQVYVRHVSTTDEHCL